LQSYLDLIRRFEVLKKNYCKISFLSDVLSKSQVSIDLQKNLLSLGKFMLDGHLDFVRHFVFFLDQIKKSKIGSSPQKVKKYD
jgi:hypothetical protein